MVRCIRRLPVKKAYNVRDLGGYMTQSGDSIKWHKLYRSDSLTNLDESDWNVLLEYGVKTVIDLRSVSETKIQGYTVPNGVTYLHCPLQKEELNLENPLKSAENAFAKSLTQGYYNIVEECTDLLANTLNQVAKGLEKGAVVFHCSAGKDRTGVLSAVLLYILGVCDEDIIADYQVSYTFNSRGINSLAKMIPNFEAIKPMLYSNAEYMQELLESFKANSLVDNLRASGLDDETLIKIKELVLE